MAPAVHVPLLLVVVVVVVAAVRPVGLVQRERLVEQQPQQPLAQLRRRQAAQHRCHYLP